MGAVDTMEGIVITKYGKPVARLVPASSSCADLIGSMKNKIRVHGKIFSTQTKWDARRSSS